MSKAKVDVLREETKNWFRASKFGMFIHWGVYAVLGQGEWTRQAHKISQDDYAKLPGQFNPKKFRPDEWATLAKEAGVKYMVFTTKHHDGFCMFDADNTGWKVTKTPYGKDILREVTDSFEAAGIRVGYYYSIMDWHHDDYLPRLAFEAEERPAEGHDVMDYIKYMREQIHQLLTQYGNAPFVLWYDGGWMNAPEDLGAAETNAMARAWHPGVLINDRHHTKEDLVTPEQRIPPTGILDDDGKPALWEACLTLTSHWWGYDKHETVFKTSDYVIRMLVDIVSKGGNLLLNVGPKPDGTIQKEFTSVFRDIGKWMAVYGESIYGTTASPFNQLPFYGRVTVKGNKLYVHVFQWPVDGKLRLPGLHNRALKAWVVGDEATRLKLRRKGSDVIVSVPEAAPHPVVSVLCVELDGAPKADTFVIRPDRWGRLMLPALYGMMEGPHGQRIRYESRDGILHVGNWYRAPDCVYWKFEAETAGTYELTIDHSVESGEGGSVLGVIVNGRKAQKMAPNGKPFASSGGTIVTEASIEFKSRSTNGKFQKRKLGMVQLDKGINEIRFQLGKVGKTKGIDLRGAMLRLQKA